MIQNLLFDMDNTLYSSNNIIEKKGLFRMLTFVANFLGITYEDARALRAKRLPYYGTTLEWISTEHNFTDTQSYFNFLHPDDEINEIEFDPHLRPLLQKLGETYHLSLLSNAPSIHVNRVLSYLNVQDLFDGIYDIETSNLLGKPHSSAYLRPIQDKGYTIANTLFFDDYQKYVRGYTALGGKAVLVGGNDQDDFTEDRPPFARISSIYEIPALLKNLSLKTDYDF